MIIILLIIFGIIFAYYIGTMPERRKNKEKIIRETLLFEEKCQAEKTKQIARIEGAITRDKINRIAKLE